MTVIYASDDSFGTPTSGGSFPEECHSETDRRLLTTPRIDAATSEGKTSRDLVDASVTRVMLGPLKVNDTELLMKPRAGGKFGLFSDWRDSVAIPGLEDDEPQLRGGVCQTEEMKERVRAILERRRKTPADSKVNWFLDGGG